MHFVAAFVLMVSALPPTRTWYPPALPLTVEAKAAGEGRLVLTEFEGKQIEPSASTQFNGAKTFDLKEFWPRVAEPGTYILYLASKDAPKDAPVTKFEGTPLVIEVRH